MVWSDGTNAADVNFYRNAAAELATDMRMVVKGANASAQQLQISAMTGPSAIRATVGSEIDLVPERDVPIHTTTWIGE